MSLNIGFYDKIIKAIRIATCVPILAASFESRYVLKEQSHATQETFEKKSMRKKGLPLSMLT